MNVLRPVLAIALIVAGLVAAGCSPEATRARGGGPGADVGNWGRPLVEIHGQTEPAYRVPTVGEAVRK